MRDRRHRGASTETLNVLQIAQNQGLTPAMALDAGALASYSTGQTWLDLTANDRDFFRGVDGSASTDDPTFNGSAGALTRNEYWSFDGGDFFTFATANDAFFNGLHKAAASYSMAFAVYRPASAATGVIFATENLGGTDVGIHIVLLSTGTLRYVVFNGAGSQTILTTTATMATGWNFIGLGVSEAGGASASVAVINGTAQTFNAAITSPSAADASDVATIGAFPGGSTALPSDSRIGSVLMTADTMNAASFASLRSALMQRYP